MRHHFHILQGFAAQENWARLAAYLDEVQGGIPEGDLGLCENATVDRKKTVMPVIFPFHFYVPPAVSHLR